MNKENILKLAKKYQEILREGEPATKNLLIGSIQLREQDFDKNNVNLVEIKVNKYYIKVENEEELENVFFLKKDTNDDYLKRPSGEKLKILKLFYENQVPSYTNTKNEENDAYIVLDLWGKNNKDKNSIFDFPLVRLRR
jgi:hypothetical protein